MISAVQVQDIHKTVWRLYQVLDDLGATRGDAGSMYEDPHPPEPGADVWYDVEQGLICVGTQSEARGFKIDEVDEAEAYILETYDSEVIF